MLLGLAIIFLILWLIGVGFHIFAGLIYVFLVIWIIALIGHFIRVALR